MEGCALRSRLSHKSHYRQRAKHPTALRRNFLPMHSSTVSKDLGCNVTAKPAAESPFVFQAVCDDTANGSNELGECHTAPPVQGRDHRQDKAIQGTRSSACHAVAHVVTTHKRRGCDRKRGALLFRHSVRARVLNKRARCLAIHASGRWRS